MIIDVVDSHGVYQGQWRKRRVFYKSCGYKIQIEKYGETESSTDNEEDNCMNQTQLSTNSCIIIDE